MNREEARARAEALVAQMSLEEAASQLRFDAPAIERLKIPAYNWWNEGLHGVARAGTATMFPQAIGLGASFDPELLRAVGHVVGLEARAKYNAAVAQGDRDIYKGLTLWSPNVNLFRDPRWGRGQETYGEDPCLISCLAVQFIHGLQGEGEGEYLLTAACAKHFAVHSGPEALRHSFDARVSRKELWETYLPAFEACVREGGVEAVMGAYNRTNGEPCCAHSYLMDEVLRGDWGFEGHYVSDCWAVRDFHEHHKVTSRPEESVKLALERGCDVNCGCTYQRIMNAYHEGLLDEALIRRSAVRLFTTRYLLGMFDETDYDNIPYEVVDCPAHAALAARAARESMVLLKNDGILPLRRERYARIAVIGPNADSRNALIGNYHGTASRYITVLEGVQEAAGDSLRVLYAQGAHLFKDREEPLAQANDRLAEARTVAALADMVILCLGLDEGLEGEEGDTGNAYASGDKLDLQLPASQRRLLQAVIESGKPFILCCMAGSAMDLSLADAHASAVLQLWYPGALGGRELARILFGEAQPGGKLPVTFYRNLEGLPEFEDYSMRRRTYRFLEKEPLYPFGYGLNYADARVLSVENETQKCYADIDNQGLELRVRVKNFAGDWAAEEVLQAYVRVAGTANEVPNPKLAAFMRISLKPGEERQLSLHIPQRAFMTVNEAGEYVQDGSGASIHLGFGQPDARTRRLSGKESIRLNV